MRYIIDTNCILRFLANDVPEQAERIEKRFRRIQDSADTVYVPHIVIVETMFQLEHWYACSRQGAAEKMTAFLAPNWIETDNKSSILFALSYYPQTSIDLVDVLLFSIAKETGGKLLSFDKDFDALSPRLREHP